MPAREHIRRLRLEVTGQVQGVGFRPYVYRLACELGLSGWVVNGPNGVAIEAQGREDALADLEARLPDELPPLAEITGIRRCDILPERPERGFQIRPSEGGELADAQVTVDTATCDDCLREMRDPKDRRARYAFINCTNCGPRYSIIRRIPYDRPNTTMSEFAMCEMCSEQYRDPSDRRFHAQPIACPNCGPAVWLADTAGRQVACEDPISKACELLQSGKIVAIKGLGGFHLACRADSQQAVRRLRRRKHRDAKPFAIMVADLAEARRLCQVTEQAARLLTGPLRPIVIMPASPDADVAYDVANGYDTLGIMLPYTPVHHLIMDSRDGPLVMTSGNYSQEPLVKDNEQAFAHLGTIADATLLHNRKIERRVDDSVVQACPSGRLQVLRRSRGYAPQPVMLTRHPGDDAPSVLAVGAELKNTICLAANGRAVVSEHIGDLKDGCVYRHFIDTINHHEELFDIQPQMLVADLHPQYLSSEYAAKRHRGDLAGRKPLPIVRVQHHHAHVASCLVDNSRNEPVIGIVCDGVGYGDDGAVWGCEVLRADLSGYERLGHLSYMPLIGADAAAVETYRPAVAALYETFGPRCRELIPSLPLPASQRQIESAIEILEAAIPCPKSSSLGRLFDAVAAICGIAEANNCEGEAPMKLEAAIDGPISDAYSFRIESNGPFAIDFRPMLEAIVFDLQAGVSPGVVSARFHGTVVRFLASAAMRARGRTGLDTVALSGGCFANRHVTDGLVAELTAQGIDVLTHRQYPCNDGAISLGQAAVAIARHADKAAANESQRVRSRPTRKEGS